MNHFSPIFLLIFATTYLVNCYSDGNIPSTACKNMIPQHNVTAQPEDTNPYNITTPFDTYLPKKALQGKSYTLVYFY